MARPNGSTKSWNNILGYTSTTNKTIGPTSFPWLSLRTTTRRTLRPWSPPSFQTRASTPSLKCPSNLLCRKLLTKSLQISKSSICTFATRYRVPSNNTRSTLRCDASRSPHSRSGTLSGWMHETSKPLAPQRSSTITSCPFPIVEKVLSHAFQLGLSLALSCIHPVFHVSLLQSTSSSEIPNRVIDPPPPIKLDDADEWEVHQIPDSRIDRHRKGSGLLYLVEWKGFDNTPDATSWEPPEHLANASDVVQAFHQAYPDKPAP